MSGRRTRQTQPSPSSPAPDTGEQEEVGTDLSWVLSAVEQERVEDGTMCRWATIVQRYSRCSQASWYISYGARCFSRGMTVHKLHTLE